MKIGKNLIATAIATTLLSTSANANWVDDWVDNATYGGGTSYQTHNRKFITGGNFSVRSQVKTDYPITISLPKISSGCGGIDGFMGGFSFLDGDYLVDKLQKMMQQAPFVAMDMALKTMSKEFSDTLKAAEDMANALNGIQLNECTSMKPLITAAMDSDPEGMKLAMGEMVNAKQIKDAGVRLWQEAKDKSSDNDNKAPVDITTEGEGCPAAVKEIFSSGSVIKNVSEKVGLSNHANLLRGYFGDVVMQKTNNMLVANSISPCPQNLKDHEGFLFGGAYVKSESGNCTKDTGINLNEFVNGKIDSIANKLASNQALSSDDIEFANTGSPIPIVRMLQVAINDGTLDHQKVAISNIVAATYSRRVADAFYDASYQTLKLASDAAKMTTEGTANKPCNMRLYADGANRVRELLREVRQARIVLNKNIEIAVAEATQFYEVTERARVRHETLKAETKSFYEGQ